jgi:hypothetical protein
MMRNVNNVLRKNRRILSQLNPNGKSKVHRDKLLSLGYQFNYLTTIYRTKSGKEYHFCYEHGLLAIDNGYYALVVRQKYVG